MTFAELNALPEPEARAAFERCCGSSRWVEAMLDGRPYDSFPAVVAASDDAFGLLYERDWMEAFHHHPMIGDVAELRKRFASTAMTIASDPQYSLSQTMGATKWPNPFMSE